MAKHCIFEHFFSFVNQNRAKPWVIVTLQIFAAGFCDPLSLFLQLVLSSLVRHLTVKAEEGF